MGKRATKKPKEVITRPGLEGQTPEAAPDHEDPDGETAAGSEAKSAEDRENSEGRPPENAASNRASAAGRQPAASADDPGIAWGPGKNFYGWAMTLLLAGLVAGVGFAGFKLFGQTVGEAESSGTGQERRKLENEVKTLGADLCNATMQAGAAPQGAADIFEQKAHGPLHALADALAEEDRPAAAKLLREKFHVEEDIRRKVPAPELAASFSALNESAMDGLRILSLPSPACPPAEAPPPAAPPPAPPAP